MILILAEMFSFIRVIAMSLFTTANAKVERLETVFYFLLLSFKEIHNVSQYHTCNVIFITS
jgi:hypothetical protein